MTKRYHRNALPVRERTFGTTFPALPRDGERFFRTDLEETFAWDSSNSAWLGMQRVVLFGKGGSGFNNEYLRAPHGLGSAANGVLFPYGIVLTGITGSWVTTNVLGDINVRRSGSNALVSALSTYSTGNTTMSRTGAYATFAADGLMQVYLDGLSSAINHPHVRVTYRRRET